MKRYSLPRHISHVVVPPIKCQGIKTNLVPFILRNIQWNGQGRWIEPFAGSGVVVFNVQPKHAVINDINPHIIRLYQAIQAGDITPDTVRSHLLTEGHTLRVHGEAYYYLVRERFNTTGDPLDFLFLNRSCFNGLMRFNRTGLFNVPFCRKPDRFRQAYVTKIVNQVARLRTILQEGTWEFRCGDWKACLHDVTEHDFVYFDPPYIGRHTDYYQQWTDDDAVEVATVARTLPCGFAVSMWKANAYRHNLHLSQYWEGLVERTVAHVYHIGPTEQLRASMEEALLIKPGYAAVPIDDTIG